MRSSFLLILAVVAVGLLLPLEAGDILVYKGTQRAKIGAEAVGAEPAFASVYFIVDLETREARRLQYWIYRGNRRQEAFTEIVDIIRANASNGKKVSLFGNSGTLQPSPVNFSHQYFSLRGPDGSVQIETQPAARSVSRPKTLTGIRSQLIGGGAVDLGFFYDATLTLTLNAALTKDANDHDRSVTQVEQLIAQRLAEQGYE
jgi:hypothetical protein